MATIRRYLVPVSVGVLLVVGLSGNVLLRRAWIDAENQAGIHDNRRARVEEGVDGLRDRRAQVRRLQRRADTALVVAAVDLLRAAGTRRLAHAELETTTVMRERAEGDLASSRQEVADAQARADQNLATLVALDRCLDGMTRAGNALGVADTDTALRAATAVEEPCGEVGVAVGT